MDFQKDFKGKLALSVFSAAICPLLYGTALGLTNLVKPIILTYHFLNADIIIRNLNLILFLGAFIANIIASQSIVERTKLMMLSSAMFCLGFCIFSSKTLEIMYLGRILQGFGVGIVSAIIPCYLSSIPPVHLRGSISSLFAMSILSGLTLGCAFHLTSLTPISILIGLSCLAVFQSVSAVFAIKLKPMIGSEPSSFLALIKNKNAHKSLLLLALSHIAQNMSGINHIIFNSSSIFGKYDNNKTVIALFLFAILISSVSSSVMDRFGRKSLLLFSSGVIISSCIGFYFAIYPKIFGFLYIFGFNMGLNSIPFVLIGEIFPVKDILQGGLFGTSCNYLGGIISMFVPVGGTQKYNPAFIVYTIVLLIYMIVIKSFFTETKGKVPGFQ